MEHKQKNMKKLSTKKSHSEVKALKAVKAVKAMKAMKVMKIAMKGGVAKDSTRPPACSGKQRRRQQT